MRIPNKPDLYSYIARNLVAPLWAWHERSPYLANQAKIKALKARSVDQIRADQAAGLRKLLDHAVRNTVYYRQALDARGLGPDDFKSVDDLAKLPLLTKELVRTRLDDMIAGNIPREALTAKKTSGSTGVSLNLYADEDSMQWKRGVTLSYDQWSGWRPGEKIAAIWGNPQNAGNWRAVVRNALLERFIYLDTLKMDEEGMSQFHDRLLAWKPTLLFGHAHSLYLFARFMDENHLAPITPRGIISTCMVLHDFERKHIEEVFGCKVTNRYGCEEVSLIACECPSHRGLHVNNDTLIVECLTDEEPAPPGEPGKIVVTDLTNFGMPFVRYQVGDMAVPSDRTCSCGCNYPLLERVEGRVADYVRTPEGKLISGISLTENFALKFEEIKQMQIIQKELDYLLFRIVRGEGFDDSTITRLGELSVDVFGHKMRWSTEFVDSIQSETSGKYRFCISELEQESRQAIAIKDKSEMKRP